ncbi:hypothetical protein [Actinacidiphila glaucinigra]|uniref:hypothetical protein n=1 Tax=Actinacidiphila glaucinigra TaxID=235986 RepID=UPI002E37EA48|nr:hypothetical protein [Actinacidiphila glaucinigra]
MRITRINSTLIAAAVCAALTMGLTGGVASAQAPTRSTAVEVEHLAARAAETGNAELIAKLGDTLSIGAKLTQEAQIESPDSAKLDELRRGLEEASRQLASVLDQSGAVSPGVTDPSAFDPGAPQPGLEPGDLGQPGDQGAIDQVGGPGDQSAADAVTDVKNALTKLVQDVTDLLAKVVAKDLAGVTAGVATVVADLQALLLAVPKLLTGALPLPLPLPLPLNDQGEQLPPEAQIAPQAEMDLQGQ